MFPNTFKMIATKPALFEINCINALRTALQNFRRANARNSRAFSERPETARIAHNSWLMSEAQPSDEATKSDT